MDLNKPRYVSYHGMPTVQDVTSTEAMIFLLLSAATFHDCRCEERSYELQACWPSREVWDDVVQQSQNLDAGEKHRKDVAVENHRSVQSCTHTSKKPQGKRQPLFGDHMKGLGLRTLKREKSAYDENASQCETNSEFLRRHNNHREEYCEGQHDEKHPRSDHDGERHDGLPRWHIRCRGWNTWR